MKESSVTIRIYLYSVIYSYLFLYYLPIKHSEKVNCHELVNHVFTMNVL